MAWDIAAIFSLITMLMPVVDQVIKWIEKLFPLAPGTEKKKKALEVLGVVVPGAFTKAAEADQVVGELIDKRVAALNASGALKHKKKLKN